VDGNVMWEAGSRVDIVEVVVSSVLAVLVV
jgi:hypothetical protein